MYTEFDYCFIGIADIGYGFGIGHNHVRDTTEI